MSDFFYLLVEAKYKNEVNEMPKRDTITKEPLQEIKESDGFVPKSFPNHPNNYPKSICSSLEELEELLDTFDNKSEKHSLVRRKK